MPPTKGCQVLPPWIIILCILKWILHQKRHYCRKNHCNDNDNDFSDYYSIIDNVIMLHYHLVLRCACAIMLHFHPSTRIPNSSLLPLLLCHKTVRKQYSRGVKDMEHAFLRPLTIRSNVFWVSKNQNSMEKNKSNFIG